MINKIVREDWRLDGYMADKEEKYIKNHPICPKCGHFMTHQSENYNLGSRTYTDGWFECPECEFCMEE